MPTNDAYDDLVDRLQRWQDSGALWRVLHRDGDRVTIGFFTCDGGEEMDRATSDRPAVLAFLGDREASDR
jgi:hypothetical protein